MQRYRRGGHGSHSSALCWIEVLYSDGFDARVSLDGKVWEIGDISIEDLVGVVEELIPEGTAGQGT